MLYGCKVVFRGPSSACTYHGPSHFPEWWHVYLPVSALSWKQIVGRLGDFQPCFITTEPWHTQSLCLVKGLALWRELHSKERNPLRSDCTPRRGVSESLRARLCGKAQVFFQERVQAFWGCFPGISSASLGGRTLLSVCGYWFQFGLRYPNPQTSTFLTENHAVFACSLCTFLQAF